jgi:hypothetical protein
VRLSYVFHERPAAYQLHGEKMLAVLSPPGLVDRPDARMPQPGQGLCLALKEPNLLLVDVAASATDFEGDRAVRLLLLGS